MPWELVLTAWEEVLATWASAHSAQELPAWGETMLSPWELEPLLIACELPADGRQC